MSLTTLVRDFVDTRAGKTSLGPLAEAACPTAYKQVRKLEKKATAEIVDLLSSPQQRDKLASLMSEMRDSSSKNCIQRILELAEELDYLDDLLIDIKQNHPTEYQTLIGQRNSVVGDLATARKLLEKLL